MRNFYSLVEYVKKNSPNILEMWNFIFLSIGYILVYWAYKQQHSWADIVKNFAYILRREKNFLGQKWIMNRLYVDTHKIDSTQMKGNSECKIKMEWRQLEN